MPIIVNMACGLANRMFQYSYYLHLKQLGYPAEVDFYHTAKLAHEEVLWDRIFPQATLVQASREMVRKLGGGSDTLSKIRRRLPFGHSVKQMQTAFDCSLPDSKHHSQYIIGVFQNAEMVDAVRDSVLQAFQFAPFEDVLNQQREQQMRQENSVAIHIRKGHDYQTNKYLKETCPVEYYQRAIAYIRERVENPKFYIFTDNPSWVREHITFFDYTLLEGNPSSGWGNHFDMQLMSCCRHNIICNSTYSWWGAYLNTNPDKIVIGPHQWFNPTSCEESTSERTLCHDWVAL